MGSEVIKSFLIGLGFSVDEGDLAAFNKALVSATLRVTALYASVQAMSAVIFQSVSSIASDFEKFGYEAHLIAPAINKTLMLRRAMLDAYSRAGIDIQKVVKESVIFNFSLAKTKFALDAIYKSVGAKFLPLLTKQMDIFRGKIYANMPKIQAALEKMIHFLFKAFEAMAILGHRLWDILGRVYDFFKKLDTATGGWSTIILGVIAAWKLLNLSFLATPLGMLLTGFLALLTLWDDFKTFKEGGESLINWGGQTAKIMVGLVAGIAAVGAAFAAWSVISTAIGLLKAFNLTLAVTNGLALLAEAPFWAIAAAIGAVVAALTAADAKFNIFGGKLSGFFSGVGGKILDFAAGGAPAQNGAQGAAGATGAPGPLGNVIANLKNNPLLGGPQVPLGTASQNNNNQNINQTNHTNINVQGGPDAQANAKAVAGQQDKVNRKNNMSVTRNNVGAAR